MDKLEVYNQGYFYSLVIKSMMVWLLTLPERFLKDLTSWGKVTACGS